jgi:multidrug efflux system membrane fusion protein
MNFSGERAKLPAVDKRGGQLSVNTSRKRVMWAVVAVALVAGGYYLFTHKPTLTAEQHGFRGGRGAASTVGVAQVTSGDVQVTLTELGTMTPAATATVHSRVDGQLMKLNFRDGQQVKQGDVLAELDARPYQAQLLQAQGQLTRDQALLANAKIDLERFQTLFAQDSIAKQQLDAQASLVKQYEGAVQSDQGAVANAKLQITYSKVQAPISGRAGIHQVDLGNIVHSGDANGIVVITQLQPIQAVFAVPEDNIPAVMQLMGNAQVNGQGEVSGTVAPQPVPVTAFDRDDKVQLATGRLTAVDNQVDTTTGTVKLQALFDNADNKLFANQFVNIHLTLQHIQNALLVPTAAVQRGQQGTFVWVVENGVVHQRNVATGPAQDPGEGGGTSITSGLQLGETVVVDGTDRLKDGAKVSVADRGAAQGVSGTMPDGNQVSGTGAVSGTHGGHHRRRGDGSSQE